MSTETEGQIIVDGDRRYRVSPGQHTILMAHGLLAKFGDEYRLSTEQELYADPGSAGVCNPHPLAVLAIVRAALSAALVRPRVEEMVDLVAVELLAHGEFGTTDGSNHRNAHKAAEAVVAIAALPSPDRVNELERAARELEPLLPSFDGSVGLQSGPYWEYQAAKKALRQALANIPRTP